MELYTRFERPPPADSSPGRQRTDLYRL